MSASPLTEVADPRVFAQDADPVHAPLLELAAASLAVSSTARADDIDRIVVGSVAAQLRSGDGLLLSELFSAAPSFPVARYLWRRLIDAWREASKVAEGEGVATMLFAMPAVIIAGTTSASAQGPTGVLADSERIAMLLREHHALAGNKNFALSNALIAADALDIARLPGLLASQRRALAGKVEILDLPPTPLAVQRGHEGVHLRFLVGHAVSAPTVDIFANADTARWGFPVATELARQLGVADVSLLALPGPPLPPPAALAQGRSAQRAVGAQLFASNAIRRLRASVGEPSAVISAHACPSAPGGGELRLSLSSVFESRDAEGFRCPLFPTDAVGDVAAMLVELLRDCRVGDVRVLPGVQADRDPTTGLTLLFKADALPAGATPAQLH